MSRDEGKVLRIRWNKTEYIAYEFGEREQVIDGTTKRVITNKLGRGWWGRKF